MRHNLSLQGNKNQPMKAVTNIQFFCISLKDSSRRSSFLRTTRNFGIPFEFFNAISVDDLRNGVTVDGCIVDISNLSWTYHERSDPRRQSAPLMFTEIACAYSHLSCWHLGKRRDVDYLVIFEDDAIICREFGSINVPADADIFYLTDLMPRNAKGEAEGYGCGAVGYILSRSGIKKCLEIFKILYMPVDLQLLAHQRSQFLFGHGLTRYRRKLRQDLYLNAYVSDQPFCYHPPQNISQIHPPQDMSQISAR
jgi:GR25 family glycosyltransferase involved in LPS biosynthesis